MGNQVYCFKSNIQWTEYISYTVMYVKKIFNFVNLDVDKREAHFQFESLGILH